MPRIEHESTERVLSQSVIERKHSFNGLELLIARGCTDELSELLITIVKNQGTTWFESYIRDEYSKSRRKVYFPILEGTKVVVKEKAPKEDASQAKLRYFTESIVHEFKTSYLLQKLLSEMELPDKVLYLGKKFRLSYEAQTPLAGILNLTDSTKRYTIFKYISGTSVRDEVALNGGWENTSQSKRELFGQFHDVLNKISNQLIKFDVEPWDLGVHQLVYTINQSDDSIHVGILDTEEYNFSARYGDHWPKSFIEIGLPVILPFLD